MQAEQELTREPFEAESVTHHDYKTELVQAGDPAPTKVRAHSTPHVQLSLGGLEGEQQTQRFGKGASGQELFRIFPSQPHDYCTEQPETFWIQRAPQLPVCEGD